MLTFASRTPSFIALGLLAAATAAQAQVIQVKPGLWASATTTTIDGQALATPPMPDDERMRQAMKRIGLPEGGQANLACEHKSSYDTRDFIKQAKLPQECRFDLLEAREDGGRYAIRCSTPQGEATGTGEAKVVDGTEARFHSESRLVVQGRTLLVETHTIDKWIGPDCRHPPAGIDPAWITPGD